MCGLGGRVASGVVSGSAGAWRQYWNRAPGTGNDLSTWIQNLDLHPIRVLGGVGGQNDGALIEPGPDFNFRGGPQSGLQWLELNLVFSGMRPGSLISRTMALVGTAGYMVPSRRLPEGLMVLPAERAAITSSGDSPVERRRAGSARIITLRADPPNGDGAETPGSEENSGRTLNSAWSCISAIVLVALQSIR